ncbi:MAG: UvrB/UvrC motif-containing protein [Patescibacteria group bacterium]
MQSQELKKFNIPDKPGVYFFLKGKDILYIGKATSLKDRTKSYFPSTALGTGRLLDSRGPLITDMVFKADSVKWQEADSVLEALILEANLIKKHQPYYNTKEKDDKSFNYVCITKDEVPKVIIVRGRNLEQKNYSKIYGPFPNGGQLKEALNLIRKIFPFLDEKSRIKGSYEFYRQIKLIPDQKEIIFQNIKNIKLLFEGNKKSILKNLEKEMKIYAKAHAFEKAGEIKRQIFALQHIQDVSLIKEDIFARRNFFLGPRGKSPDQLEKVSPRESSARLSQKQFSARSVFRVEAYDIAHLSGKDMVGVMVVLEDGELAKNEYRKFKIRNFTSSNDVGALSEMLTRRFKHTEWVMPDLIVVDGSTAQRNVALKILKEFKLNIPVSAVVKDDKHKAKMILSADPKLKKVILLANSEAHRFAIKYHKEKRNKSFIY